jgi:hypothetical protein
LNYTQSYETENVVANGSVVTTRMATTTGYEYYVGATKLRTIDPEATISSPEVVNDAYLGQLLVEGKSDEVQKILDLENQYLTMLREKYSSGSETDWFVKYQKNSTTGAYEPVFYNKEQVESADYSDKTGASLSGIRSYVYGQTIETREVKNAQARVEQDTSGRFVSVFIYDLDAEGKRKDTGTEYTLTARTESDERGYNDAMNQYNYNKAKYDQEIQAINAKIEVIQGQDKDLELRLKQLDTEENAISTEMEAVKKVIQKNVETSFKTFNA